MDTIRWFERKLAQRLDEKIASYLYAKELMFRECLAYPQIIRRLRSKMRPLTQPLRGE